MEELLAPLKMKLNVKRQIIRVGQDVKNLVETIENKSLVVGMGGGGNLVKRLQKDFSWKFPIALLSYNENGDLQFRKPKRDESNI